MTNEDLINDLTISHFLKNMTWENVGVHSTHKVNGIVYPNKKYYCLLYTSDAADE